MEGTFKERSQRLVTLRHSIRVMRRHDLNKKNTMAKTKTKTETMTETNTFREHRQRDLSLSLRILTVETLITILTLENLNS